jgi:WD40 repeat protein
MGVVYRARDVKLNRLVALKMILAGGHAGEAELARFRREAEAVAQLQHPHIVQIHEIGEQDGLPYFALEFVAGGSLADRLDGTPLPQQQAAQLVGTLARAMHAAHERGIVHRDLKPANVLLTAEGAPKVTDFGLAKRLDMEGQTQSGAVMGTPSYMAPEQAAGKSKEIGPAADVYALGAILYELLTGRPPFKAATSLDTILQVVSNEPVAPRQLQPGTARDLDTICLKCLCKEPGKRYSSAEDLAEDLRRFQSGEPIAARPVGRLERGWRWCRRNPAVASLLALVAVTLLVGTGVAWWLALEAEASARVARTEKDSAEKALQRAEEEKSKAQQNLVTSQLLRVGMLFENNPDAALMLLDDQDTIPVGSRDAAWGFYNGYCRRKVRTLTGQNGPIPSVAFSRDGKMLASASSAVAGEVTLWDVATGELRAILKGHSGEVTSLAWSRDGKTVASGGVAIKLWDVATGRVRTFKEYNGLVFSVAWNGDGKTLAYGGGLVDRPGEVKLWDVETGQVRTLKGHTAEVASVAWSMDGKAVASGTGHLSNKPGEVKLWDVATGQVRATLIGHVGGITSLAWSGDGKTLASASKDSTIKLWDVTTRQERASLRGHSGAVLSVSWSVDGKTLASASSDQTIKLWDAVTGQERVTLWGHKSWVKSVVWGGDGKTLASASADGTIKLWDLAATPERATFTGHSGGVCSVAWSRDGKALASANSAFGKSGEVKLWDVATGQVRSLKGHKGVTCVAWSGDGKTLASGGGEFKRGEVKLWDVATGEERPTLRGHNSPVTWVGWSEDGKTLASASRDGTIKLWDVAKGQVLVSLEGNNRSFVVSVAWSRDSKTLAFGGLGVDAKGTPLSGEVKLWDVAKGRVRATLEGHTGGITSLAWSADGKTLASAGAGLDAHGKSRVEVKLWDTITGRERVPLKGQNNPVFAVAWSANGRTLALAGPPDRTIKLRDVATGQERATLKGHNGPVLAVAWSADGRTLASASEDGTIKLWDVTTGGGQDQ